MEFTAKEIAQLIGGTVDGNADAKVNQLAKIEEGNETSLSFLANVKYLPYIYTTKSAVVIVSSDFIPEQPLNCTLVRADDPYTAFATLLEVYDKMRRNRKGISERAVIGKSVKLGEDVYVGDFVIINDNVSIGNNVKIYPNCYIGENVSIDDDTTLFPNVIIYYDCKIGKCCTLHGGVIIGADGFGFAPQTDHNYKKIAQIGNVIIEDNVEIGANTTIDRATMGSTHIRQGVKLDNLIQVGHNVEIGENTVIAAQVGIAGSTKLGKNMMVGGQVGFAGHITIADNVKIGAQAGLPGDVKKEGSILIGYPAIELSKWRRMIAITTNIEKLYNRISELENKIKQMEDEKEK